MELVLSFVNTFAGGQPDRLADGAGLRAWLAEAGFDEPDVSEADAACARELRDALQAVLLAHAHEQGADAGVAEAYLARIAARYPLVAVVGADGAQLLPAQPGFPGVLAAILAAATELALRGEWGRLKACRNPICHFGFYDTSRNASAAFHSSNCRSMVAMRAYRERKKLSSG
jgi:predicted RNA-binding Zn ribbon-like protein